MGPGSFVTSATGWVCGVIPERVGGGAPCTQLLAGSWPLVLPALLTVAVAAILWRRRMSSTRSRSGDDGPVLVVPPSRDRKEGEPRSGRAGTAAKRLPAGSPGIPDAGGKLVPGGQPGPEDAPGEPSDATLQILPGRFELQAGPNQRPGRVLRFVQTPGHPPEVTFGRDPGPPARHVQLHSRTASRSQAAARFDGKRWRIRNLSETNPTLVNDVPLDGAQPSEVVLRDGDRIEMGDVSFLFRQPETPRPSSLRSSWYSDRCLQPVNRDAVVVRQLGSGRTLAAVCDAIGAGESRAPGSRRLLDELAAALDEGAGLDEAFRRATSLLEREGGREGGGDPGRVPLAAALCSDDSYTLVSGGSGLAHQVDSTGIRRVPPSANGTEGRPAPAVEELPSPEDEPPEAEEVRASSRPLALAEYSGRAPHVLVLSSDGVHGVLGASGIELVVRATPDVRHIARNLCEEAIRQGAEDSVTAVAVAFGGGLGADPSGSGRRFERTRRPG